jgi:ketosteroid isomerase-like protein
MSGELNNQSEINKGLVPKLFEYLGNQHWDGLRAEVFAPDAVWTIPGHNPISGKKTGVAEIIGFLSVLGRANYQAELVYLDGNTEVVVEVHRGKAEVGTARLDVGAGAVYRFKHGRISEIWNMTDDQFALDAFYWTVFSLKPLPERLAA